MDFYDELERARNGDAEALERLLKDWRAEMRTMSTDLLGSAVGASADTSDVVQGGLLQVWQDLPRFRGSTPGEFAAWARKICRGHAAKVRRHHSAIKRTPPEHQIPLETTVDPAADPAESYEVTERLLQTAQALAQLEEPMRSVVFLHVVEGCTFVEIGRKLECTERVIRGNFARGVERLRSLCKQAELGVAGIAGP